MRKSFGLGLLLTSLANTAFAVVLDPSLQENDMTPHTLEERPFQDQEQRALELEIEPVTHDLQTEQVEEHDSQPQNHINQILEGFTDDTYKEPASQALKKMTPEALHNAKPILNLLIGDTSDYSKKNILLALSKMTPDTIKKFTTHIKPILECFEANSFQVAAVLGLSRWTRLSNTMPPYIEKLALCVKPILNCLTDNYNKWDFLILLSDSMDKSVIDPEIIEPMAIYAKETLVSVRDERHKMRILWTLTRMTPEAIKNSREALLWIEHPTIEDFEATQRLGGNIASFELICSAITENQPRKIQGASRILRALSLRNTEDQNSCVQEIIYRQTRDYDTIVHILENRQTRRAQNGRQNTALQVHERSGPLIKAAQQFFDSRKTQMTPDQAIEEITQAIQKIEWSQVDTENQEQRTKAFAVWGKLLSEGLGTQLLQYLPKAVDYVKEKGKLEFYVQNSLFDSMYAYDGSGDRSSCVRGTRERFLGTALLGVDGVLDQKLASTAWLPTAINGKFSLVYIALNTNPNAVFDFISAEAPHLQNQLNQTKTPKEVRKIFKEAVFDSIGDPLHYTRANANKILDEGLAVFEDDYFKRPGHSEEKNSFLRNLFSCWGLFSNTQTSVEKHL